MTWYIDALDPRAGVAFAKQRDADLLRSQSLTDDGPTVFVGPPSFIPESVATRSIGFAMARNQGQLGLFAGDNELPFDTLAAISEFMRRVYLRGAAGDGAGENGGGAPPPAPEGGEPPRDIEGPRGMDSDNESMDPVATLQALAAEMQIKSKKLSLGDSSSVDTLPTLRPARGSNTRVRRVTRGALRVMRELYRRSPAARTSADRLRWITSLSRFITIVTRMGLWPLMQREFRHPNELSAWVLGYPVPPPVDHEFDYLVRSLLQHGMSGFDIWRWIPNVIWSVADSFEDLALLPVPYKVSVTSSDGQNVQSLLSAAVATPNQVFDGSSRGVECAELTLFAATYLNLDQGFSPVTWGERYDFIDYFDQFVVRAHAWLAENSPKIVYEKKVETFISDTSQIAA